MIRATTPTHRFMFPEEVQLRDLEKVQVTYTQTVERGCGKTEEIITTRTNENIDIDEENNIVSVRFTQEEMNRFHEGVADIQVRVKDYGGNVLACRIFKVRVKKILNKEIL